MRGTDEQQNRVFSYISAEKRVPQDHPLRAIRTMVDVILSDLPPHTENGFIGTRRSPVTQMDVLAETTLAFPACPVTGTNDRISRICLSDKGILFFNNGAV